MNNAINDTNWRENAIRFIILVGDAPSHRAGHKWNLSGQNEDTLRSMANDGSVSIFAVHIFNPKAKKFQELSLEQYKTLSTNKGNTQPSFKEVLSSDLDQFQEFTDTITSALAKNIDRLKIYKFSDLNSSKEEPIVVKDTPKARGELSFVNDDKKVDIDTIIDNDYEDNKSVKGLATNMFRSALIQWIGSTNDNLTL